MASQSFAHFRTSFSAFVVLALTACAIRSQSGAPVIPSTRTINSLSNVRITEYSLKAIVSSINAGEGAVSPSGDLYVANSFDIVRVSPNGTPSGIPIPNPYCSYANLCTLAQGPVAFRDIDDTIWFNAQFVAGTAGNGGVEWMTSSGTILGQTSSPYLFDGTTGNVTIGSDGRAWFPQCGAPTPGVEACVLSAASETGIESDYDLGQYVGNTVAAGPDGNLYLSEVRMTGNASNVAQISTSGKTLRRFPLPAGSVVQGVASGVAVGHTGDVWVVENGINKIARVSPNTGTVTQYPIPTANADARNITLGSDCNLWFTEFGANKIGRVTDGGRITEYPIPTTAAGADGIVGPSARGCSGRAGGYVWFTEDNADAVAKLFF